jgi:hypothetical protein
MSGFPFGSNRGFRAQYAQDIARNFARPIAPSIDAPLLTEADLAPLPAAVQRYIRLSGALDQPRVRDFRARFHGRIRSGPKARWMAFTGEQHNFYDPANGPSRFFLMDASMLGLPVQVYHRYVDAQATMRVKAVSLWTMVDASGPDMDAAETVTVFNDLCVFAPGALIDHDIRWGEIDPRTIHAHFAHRDHVVRAVLSFNEAGELTDFVSDDRAVVSSNGRAFTKMRWSTPLSDYRAFGRHRVMGRGQCVWHLPEGEYAYLQLDLDAIDYNLASQPQG